MGTLANSEDPHEMPNYAAFHQGLHCLHRKINDLQRKKYIFLEIITCDPSIYATDCRDLTVSNFMRNSIKLSSVR